MSIEGRVYCIPSYCLCTTCGYVMQTEIMERPFKGVIVAHCENIRCSDMGVFLKFRVEPTAAEVVK